MPKIMAQSLAVLSAPLLYGVLCLPLMGFVLEQFPEHINARGGTHNPRLVFYVEVMQLITLFLGGVVVQWIAGRSDTTYWPLIIATLTMLGIGIAVQYQYWSAMPTWHHYIFFLIIVVAMPAGALWVRHPGPSN